MKNSANKQQGNSNKKDVPGRPFPPGVSGNPNGRPPKGDAWADAYNAVLDSKEVNITIIDKKGKPKEIKISTKNTIRTSICAVMAQKALNGDVGAAKELADRTAGRPTQALGHSFNCENIPLPVIYLPDNGRNPIEKVV